jgi:hypothetical protein
MTNPAVAADPSVAATPPVPANTCSAAARQASDK